MAGGEDFCEGASYSKLLLLWRGLDLYSFPLPLGFVQFPSPSGISTISLSLWDLYNFPLPLGEG